MQSHHNMFVFSKNLKIKLKNIPIKVIFYQQPDHFKQQFNFMQHLLFEKYKNIIILLQIIQKLIQLSLNIKIILMNFTQT
ncbi:unnamed protein product [Paramecium sonneborni]|uniref:Uncharacterized protein n=1 Tax=Paramecium sonneborni TaxID=65129 RepID=A0A8S1MJX2_9CILI|nr:unnamed protein product [Paramecium sonneborni]